MEKRTRNEAKWKIRTRQDRSLRNRVVQFTSGAAQGGARTCRWATDSVHCRLWWKDKFPQYRVFRNCGSSEKRSAATRWSRFCLFLFFFWTSLYICFPCFVFFCVLKNGFSVFFWLSFLFFSFSFFFLKNSVSHVLFFFKKKTNWGGWHLRFSFCLFLFYSFSVLWFFLKSFVCEIIVFILKLLVKFLVDPFSLHFFLKKKLSPTKNCFVVFQSVFCFTFFFLSSFFTFFLSSILSFITFSFHLFVHLLLRFSPLSFLTFISLSPCFFFSFFCLVFPYLFFFIAVFAYLLFVLTHFSFLSFVFDLICLDFLLLYPFFHLRVCFAKKIKKFIFHDEIQSSFF